ncbi:MAG: 5-(carboxyamino)imidazole ribonucleotide synthase [Verrucomicrobiales bacterium]|nr:5-(carboxyamino)imidazole ribonucleotide synthase [Verrucomicrobiales bacterium]
MKDSLPPGSTIGVLGGGQLGRMLTIASRRMGYRVLSWIGGPDTGPAGLADEVIEEPFDSADALALFLEKADVATVEFENIPLSLLEAVEGAIPLYPGSGAIATCQHREREKAFLSQNAFPCAHFHVIDSAPALASALPQLPTSGGILKTAEFGYDGKGQLPVSSTDSADSVWSRFDAPRAVLEEKINLAGELSVLVVRDLSGKIVTYDPVENIHRDHILDISRVPACLPEEVAQQAREVATGIAEALDYVGILAVEFFLSQSGDLLVNEMAPRPHNSGHHTIDACETSQFEQQLRCLIGAKPGSTRLHSPTMMLNLLGDVWGDADGKPPWDEILALPGSHLHLYGKAEARRGRKMGHVTFTGADADSVLATQTRAREILKIPELADH